MGLHPRRRMTTSSESHTGKYKKHYRATVPYKLRDTDLAQTQSISLVTMPKKSTGNMLVFDDGYRAEASNDVDDPFQRSFADPFASDETLLDDSLNNGSTSEFSVIDPTQSQKRFQEANQRKDGDKLIATQEKDVSRYVMHRPPLHQQGPGWRNDGHAIDSLTKDISNIYVNVNATNSEAYCVSAMLADNADDFTYSGIGLPVNYGANESQKPYEVTALEAAMNAYTARQQHVNAGDSREEKEFNNALNTLFSTFSSILQNNDQMLEQNEMDILHSELLHLDEIRHKVDDERRGHRTSSKSKKVASSESLMQNQSLPVAASSRRSARQRSSSEHPKRSSAAQQTRSRSIVSKNPSRSRKNIDPEGLYECSTPTNKIVVDSLIGKLGCQFQTHSTQFQASSDNTSVCESTSHLDSSLQSRRSMKHREEKQACLSYQQHLPKSVRDHSLSYRSDDESCSTPIHLEKSMSQSEHGSTRSRSNQRALKNSLRHRSRSQSHHQSTSDDGHGSDKTEGCFQDNATAQDDEERQINIENDNDEDSKEVVQLAQNSTRGTAGRRRRTTQRTFRHQLSHTSRSNDDSDVPFLV
jgi:hypothetical protein